jgi:hypothetical protein
MKFADIEELLVEYLTAQLPGTTIADAVPQEGTRFVVVQRTGSSRTTRVSETPTVPVDAYDITPGAAYELADSVRAAIDRWPLEDRRVKSISYVGGIARLPDVRHTSDRYTMTPAIHIRGRKATA